MLYIPKTIYEHELIKWLSTQQNEKENNDKSSDYATLIKLLSVCLDEERESKYYPYIGNIILADEEIGIISRYKNSCNTQVSAYSKDICSRKVKDKTKLSLAESASYDYLSLYTTCKAPWYLLRSIKIRALKPLKSDLYIKEVCSTLQRYIFPHWMKKICIELRRLYSPEDLLPISEIMIKKIEEITSCPHRDDERAYLEALEETGYINSNELHFKKALSYEAELDYVNSNKEPNTIYPANVDIIQNAYNEINKVKKEHPIEHEKIRKKLIEEQKQFCYNLQKYAPTIKYTISDSVIKKIHKYTDSISIKMPIDALIEIAKIPFNPKKYFDRESQKLSGNILYSAFGNINIGDNGQILGVANIEDSRRIEIYRYYRPRINLAIKYILEKSVEISDNNNEDNLFQEICYTCRTKCIEKSHQALWIKGFILALKGDIIAAVHMLIPQMERYLVNKAESIYGNLSVLENESHQDGAGLGKVLDKLQNYFREDLYNDLRYFLNMGADINMRNNIAHGLWSTETVYNNAPYCIWLATKMYFREEEIFTQ